MGVLLLLGAVSCARQAGAGDGGALVLYSGRSEALVGPIIDEFRDATGIEVSVNYGSTSGLAATLLEEGNNSPADVYFAQDPSGLGAVAHALVPLPEELLALVPSWARAADGRWVGISGRARVVAYNTDAVAVAELPSSLAGFTHPKWKRRLGWAPTNGSFQAMITAMRVMWGEERTGEWLEGVQANEPRVYPKNTPIVAAAGSGEIDVGFVNHYYLHRFIQERGEGFGARNHYLTDGGPGSVVLVSGVGILSTARNRENAEEFIRFMLSTLAQQYYASQTFEYPLVEGIKADTLLAPLAEINNPNIDTSSLADLEGTQRLLREVGAIP